MPIDWSVVKKDIEDAASAYESAKHLINLYCGRRKNSTWLMVGECALCAGNIAYRVYAVFQNGAVIAHSHSLNGADCPHCQEPIGPSSVRHRRVDDHEQ